MNGILALVLAGTFSDLEHLGVSPDYKRAAMAVTTHIEIIMPTKDTTLVTVE